MSELSTVPKTTGEQLLNQAVASLLWNIKWLTSHDGQTGEFGYTLGDVSYVAMIAMLAPHVQDTKLRETLHAGVSEFLNRTTPVLSKSECVALLHSISTLAMNNSPVTAQYKEELDTLLEECKQGGCITVGQYNLAIEQVQGLPDKGPFPTAPHN